MSPSFAYWFVLRWLNRPSELLRRPIFTKRPLKQTNKCPSPQACKKWTFSEFQPTQESFDSTTRTDSFSRSPRRENLEAPGAFTTRTVSTLWWISKKEEKKHVQHAIFTRSFVRPVRNVLIWLISMLISSTHNNTRFLPYGNTFLTRFFLEEACFARDIKNGKQNSWSARL